MQKNLITAEMRTIIYLTLHKMYKGKGEKILCFAEIVEKNCHNLPQMDK